VDRLGIFWRRIVAVDPVWVDYGLAMILTAGAQLEYAPHDHFATGIDPKRIFMVLATLPLAARRRYPMTVFSVVFAATLIVGNGVGLVIFLGLVIAGYSLAAYSASWWGTLALVVVMATLVDIVYGGSPPPIPDLAVPFSILVPLWMAGKAIRSRQLRAESLEDRARRLEREREVATLAAVAEERARIARELHDVVSHSVSVMVIQAGAARKLLRDAPDTAEESLHAVESSGRDAMAELRHLLDLLNQDGAEAALTPQPSMERLPELVERVREAGLAVDLRIQGTPRALPPGIDLVAYRVIQEGLTNALRYAASAPTAVIVDYAETMLKLEILDEGRGSEGAGSGGGRGVLGLRERVAVYGGRLEAGRRLDGGYALRAYLPTMPPPAVATP
jgi:signal transduction histidine kinase